MIGGGGGVEKTVALLGTISLNFKGNTLAVGVVDNFFEVPHFLLPAERGRKDEANELVNARFGIAMRITNYGWTDDIDAT